MNIWVGDLAKRDFKPITKARDQGITNCFWIRDGSRILYIQDNQGDDNNQLFALDVASGEARDLTPFGKVRVETRSFSLPTEGPGAGTCGGSTPCRSGLPAGDMRACKSTFEARRVMGRIF